MEAENANFANTMAAKATPEQIEKMKKVLINPDSNLAQRVRICHTLRNLGGKHAIDALSAGLAKEAGDSALLKHELCYALGQLSDPYATTILLDTLQNTNEHFMVRHEAGEALGAIALPEFLPVLEKYSNDSAIEVAETCQLAVDRIKWFLEDPANRKSKLDERWLSVDPAPTMQTKDVSVLRKILLDPSKSLFERYSAMFALRDIGGKDAVEALCVGLDDKSALFRHEVAFVFGQLQDTKSVEALTRRLFDQNENCMVRHEAAESLGAMNFPDSKKLMLQFKNDPERAVRESCEVALDMIDYYASNQFEYADGLQNVLKQEQAV